MPIERISGNQISYWVSGKGFTEGREYVLFIHGAGGGQYTWSYQKGYFEKEFNHIIINSLATESQEVEARLRSESMLNMSMG